MKEKLLSAIACPKCHGPLQYDPENQALRCKLDKLVYPIKAGIPALLASEAKSFSESI